ncbi:MAG: hypothetical protein EOP33_01885 [Rickettsiaceae bacterium]|nr:MAG: hypothetical protein EOP33_01885 [Rickettsiaceae bacterium]
MVVLYLVALAGTGKYTIAQEFIKYGYKIIDSHLINNAIFSLIKHDIDSIDDKAWQAVRQIRQIVINFALSLEANIVFTNELLNTTGDSKLYNKIVGFAQKKNALFVPVKLLISADERASRISNIQRTTRFKIIKDSRIESQIPSLFPPTHENLLEIDVTNLNPEAAAKQILDFISVLLQKNKAME